MRKETTETIEALAEPIIVSAARKYTWKSGRAGGASRASLHFRRTANFQL
ncbi:MAG TPA: hypothetical protein VK446_01100 [Methylocystis sp.]|nr:hypothetical protein [Methylocystis sp.]